MRTGSVWRRLSHYSRLISLALSPLSTLGVSLRTLSIVLILLMAHLAVAAPAEAPSRLFEGKDLFGLQRVTDPQIRPDGGAVAYVRERYDIMTDRAQHSIWLVDTDTGAQHPCRPARSSVGRGRS